MEHFEVKFTSQLEVLWQTYKMEGEEVSSITVAMYEEQEEQKHNYQIIYSHTTPVP